MHYFWTPLYSDTSNIYMDLFHNMYSVSILADAFISYVSHACNHVCRNWLYFIHFQI